MGYLLTVLNIGCVAKCFIHNKFSHYYGTYKGVYL